MTGSPVLGIDFGTSNTAAAWVDAKNRVRVVPVREGVYLLPSVVWYGEQGQVLVGDSARQQLIEDPVHTIHGLKRFIGRRWTSPFVHRNKDHFGYKMVEGGDGLVAVDLFGHKRPLEDVAVEIIQRIMELSTASMRAKPESACLTVPAHYGYAQRQAIRAAAVRAGLKVKAMVNEPTAAAMYYARKKGNDGRVLVFDLGGGTFDATLLAVMGGVVKVLATGGDAFLGGQDFDARIVEELATRFERDTNIDLRPQTVSMWRTFVAAEAAKVSLSSNAEARVRVPCVTVDQDRFLDLDYVITRKELEEMAAPLIEKCLGICETILKQANVEPEDVDEIVFVGGQTRMPAIQRRLAQIFNTNPEKHIHPDLGVAVGAALLARGDQSLIDVVSAPMGIMVPGVGAKELVPANTTIPSVKRLALGMRPAEGQPLVMALYESPDASSLEREHLGTTRAEADWLDDNPGDLEIEAWVGDDLSLSLALHADSGGRLPLQIERPTDDEKPAKKKKKKKAAKSTADDDDRTFVDTGKPKSMEDAAKELGIEVEEESDEYEYEYESAEEIVEDPSESTNVDEPGKRRIASRTSDAREMGKRGGPLPPGFKSIDVGMASDADTAIAHSQKVSGSKMPPPAVRQAAAERKPRSTGPGERRRSVSTSAAGGDSDEGRVPQVGESIGNYKLVDLLGQGGMGRVYLAEHAVLGRRVALKMLRRRFSENPQAVERFQSEARAVNQIRHENIIQVTDFLTAEGFTCYIMELLEGRSVAELLSSVGVPRIDRALRIGLQVADAMVAVHDAAIIHRDLKPENIFLTEKEGRDNFVKLLDFGVAKLVDSEGRSVHETGIGDAIGTPEYMSPEQLVGGQVDHRSDIYSLGVVLYELVTGVKPFNIDDSVGEAVFQQLMQPPVPPTQRESLPHSIPPELETLILQCLEKQADGRPRSMREVRGRLEALLEQQARLMRTTRVNEPVKGDWEKPTKAVPPPERPDPTQAGATEPDESFEQERTAQVDESEAAATTALPPTLPGPPEPPPSDTGFPEPPVSNPGLDLVLLPGDVLTPAQGGPETAADAAAEAAAQDQTMPTPRSEAPTPNLSHSSDLIPATPPTDNGERNRIIAIAAAISVGVLLLLGVGAFLLLSDDAEGDEPLIWAEPSDEPVDEPKDPPVPDKPVDEPKDPPVPDKPVDEPKDPPVEDKPVDEPKDPPVEQPKVEEPKDPPVEDKPAKERVKITFDSKPRGAEVFLPGRSKSLGKTPFSVTVRPSKKAQPFEFKKDGYKAQRKTLEPPKDDLTFEVVLEKQ
jgi:molecular chaperone DnaK